MLMMGYVSITAEITGNKNNVNINSLFPPSKKIPFGMTYRVQESITEEVIGLAKSHLAMVKDSF